MSLIRSKPRRSATAPSMRVAATRPGRFAWTLECLRASVSCVNPLRRVLEAAGLKPKTRKKRLSGLTTAARSRFRRR
jgi:hypothetical protein